MGCTCTHRVPPPRAAEPPPTVPSQVHAAKSSLRNRGGACTDTMKLFAYEHPSGPVHEVEVTLGDTVQRRRRITQARSPPPRRWGKRGAAGPSPGREAAARARSRRLSRILDRAAPTAPAAPTVKQTRAGPPAQVQDRAGHADSCVGVKFQAAIETRRCPRDRVGSMAWRFTKVHASG